MNTHSRKQIYLRRQTWNLIHKRENVCFKILCSYIFKRIFNFIFSVSKTKGIIAMKNYEQETCMTAIYYFPSCICSIDVSVSVSHLLTHSHSHTLFSLLYSSIASFPFPPRFVHLKLTYMINGYNYDIPSA